MTAATLEQEAKAVERKVRIEGAVDSITAMFEPFAAMGVDEVLYRFDGGKVTAVAVDPSSTAMIFFDAASSVEFEFRGDGDFAIDPSWVRKAMLGLKKTTGKDATIKVELSDDTVTIDHAVVSAKFPTLDSSHAKPPSEPNVQFDYTFDTDRPTMDAAIATIASMWDKKVANVYAELLIEGGDIRLNAYLDRSSRRSTSVLLGHAEGSARTLLSASLLSNLLSSFPRGAIRIRMGTDKPIRAETVGLPVKVAGLLAPRIEDR